MNGLYNVVFGVNPHAHRLLQILGLSEDRVPRFRDCFLHLNEIVIHTRTGGTNRDSYDSAEVARRSYPEGEHAGPWNEDLQKNVNFLRDEDDTYDSTSANFFFRIPSHSQEEVAAIRADGGEQEMPAKRWQEFLKR